MKKRMLSLLSLLLAGMLTLTACGNGGQTTGGQTDEDMGDAQAETTDVGEGMVDTSQFKKDGPYTIGFSNISVVNTFRVQMVRELEYAAEQAGVTLYTTDAGGDTSKQVSDIQDLMARGIDALLVAPGCLQASDLRQLMGGLDGLGIVAQHVRGQQQGGDVQVTLDDCISQTGHQCHSLATRNALAICTGVIVFRTIPTSPLMETPRGAANENKNVRWSGLYTLNVYKCFLN